MSTLVIIPTYNERENVASIVGRVRTSTPDVFVLVVDDSSPDGTGDIADALAAADDHVLVLHRAGKEGLGAAYREGMRWASRRGLRPHRRNGCGRLAPPGRAAPSARGERIGGCGARLALGPRRRRRELAGEPAVSFRAAAACTRASCSVFRSGT